jgi:hypothetical protein
MECSTGYMTWRNASEALMHDVVLWQKLLEKTLPNKARATTLILQQNYRVRLIAKGENLCES